MRDGWCLIQILTPVFLIFFLPLCCLLALITSLPLWLSLVSQMLSLTLSAPLFLHQHSWRCSACSIYVTTTRPSITPPQYNTQSHTHTHTHTHTTQPILSQLVFQSGSRIWQSSSIAWGSGLIKAHYNHVECYRCPLLSVPVRLIAIWFGWKGLTGAVWGYTSHWKSS